MVTRVRLGARRPHGQPITLAARRREPLMPGEVLSRQALNRALLERQMLLRRWPAPGSAADRSGRVVRAVEHLLGLQAQAPFPPYYGLWSRLAEFRPDELSALITGRQVVRIAL